LILDDHEPRECVEVCARRLVRQRTVRAAGVARERRAAGVRGDVAGEAAQQRANPRRVASRAADPRHVHAADLFQVVAHAALRALDWELAEAWPAADGDLVRELSDGRLRIGAARGLAGEQRRE